MRNPLTLAWQGLAFVGLAGVVAWMWASYPRVEPLGPTGAAWVQAVGSVMAIIVSAAFAIGVPLYVTRQRVQKRRRALIVLLEGICQEIDTQKWHVEVSGQQGTEYVPEVILALADQLAAFPVHELDDPVAIKETSEAALYLRITAEAIRPERHRPRVVWDKLHSRRHSIWQRGIWAKHRYGWGPANENGTPYDAFGTNPQLARMFTWDEDGNPTAITPVFAPPLIQDQD